MFSRVSKLGIFLHFFCGGDGPSIDDSHLYQKMFASLKKIDDLKAPQKTPAKAVWLLRVGSTRPALSQ